MIIFAILFVFAFCTFLIGTIIEMFRLSAFSDKVTDIIAFRYASSYNDYLAKTDFKVIPYCINRKKIDIDVTGSYRNFKTYHFWNWDFENMIVEE